MLSVLEAWELLVGFVLSWHHHSHIEVVNISTDDNVFQKFLLSQVNKVVLTEKN